MDRRIGALRLLISSSVWISFLVKSLKRLETLKSLKRLETLKSLKRLETLKSLKRLETLKVAHSQRMESWGKLRMPSRRTEQLQPRRPCRGSDR